MPAVQVCAADAAQGNGGTAAGDQAAGAKEPEVLAAVDFDAGIDGWYYGAGWEYDYSAKDTSSVEAEDGQLKFTVDYSKDQDKGWSQATAVWEPKDGKGWNLSGATAVTMLMTYDPSKMTTGSFAVKVFCDEGLDASTDVDFASAKELEDGRKQIPVSISFEALGAKASDVKKFAVQLIGKKYRLSRSSLV